MPFNFNPFTGRLDLTSTGTVIGTGTSGQIAYWNGTSSLTGDADFTFDGTDVTLGSNLKFPAIVAGETKGVIYKSTARFLHSYQPATGGFLSNLFLGTNAGNFTLNGNGNAWEAGGNLGLGEGVLTSLTYGFQNVGAGHSALTLLTNGNNNFAMGANTLTKITTEVNNTAIGSEAIRFTKASYNVGIGGYSITGVNGVSTSPSNVGLGFQTLKAITTGVGGNIAIGYRAGDVITSGSKCIIIGLDCDPTGATAANELNIGLVLYGVNMYSTTGTGRIGIDVVAPTARLHLPAGTTTASSAPLKITTGGSLMTAAENGAIETTSDKIYYTIPTGTARKEFTLNDAALTSGRVPFVTTNGRLTDDSAFTFDGYFITVKGAKFSGDNALGYTGLFVGNDGANAMGWNEVLIGDDGSGNPTICADMALRRVGIGSPIPSGLLSILHVGSIANGDNIFRLESPGGGAGNPTMDTFMSKITTTNATATTIHTFSISSSYVFQIRCEIVGHRTGGVAGTVDDSAAYELYGVWKYSGGVVQIGTTDKTAKEDQAGWDVNFVVSGNDLLVQVTGATNNNIAWSMNARVNVLYN